MEQGGAAVSRWSGPGRPNRPGPLSPAYAKRWVYIVLNLSFLVFIFVGGGGAVGIPTLMVYD